MQSKLLGEVGLYMVTGWGEPIYMPNNWVVLQGYAWHQCGSGVCMVTTG